MKCLNWFYTWFYIKGWRHDDPWQWTRSRLILVLRTADTFYFADDNVTLYSDTTAWLPMWNYNWLFCERRVAVITDLRLSHVNCRQPRCMTCTGRSTGGVLRSSQYKFWAVHRTWLSGCYFVTMSLLQNGFICVLSVCRFCNIHVRTYQ